MPLLIAAWKAHLGLSHGGRDGREHSGYYNHLYQDLSQAGLPRLNETQPHTIQHPSFEIEQKYSVLV